MASPDRPAASCDACESENDPRDSVFQQTRVEVDQQADALLHEPHVGQQLSFEDWDGALDALDLDENEILNNKVDPILAEQMPFVVSGNRSLECVLNLDVGLRLANSVSR